MDVKGANNDIQLIKEILNQTQYDISKTGNFFIWVGIANLLSILLKEIAYFLLDSLRYISSMHWVAIRSVDIIVFIVITLVYLFYYTTLMRTGNDLSKSILKMWGILIIGGKVFLKIFFEILLEVYSGVPAEAGRALEKSAFFLLISIGFLFMGLLVHDKKIILSNLSCIVLYLALLSKNLSVAIGSIHGNDVNMYAHDILISALLSIGMILSGIYIRCRRAGKGGDS